MVYKVKIPYIVEDNKMNGRVKFYNEEKGFGFIQADDGQEYFVHQTGLNEGVMLSENAEVTFDVTEGDRGPKAVNVSLGSAAPAEEPAQEEASEESAEEASEEPAPEGEEEPKEE